MQPPCQGKQRRDQTIIRTSPQLPAVCISRGERSQPVWTAHRWACQHLCPAPRCCPQPVQGPFQRGPRCCHPLHARSRCFEHPTVARSASWGRHNAFIHLAQTYNLFCLAPPAKGHRCTGAAVTSATAQPTYLFFLIAACNTARAQLDS